MNKKEMSNLVTSSGTCCRYPIDCYYNRARLRLHEMLKLYNGLCVKRYVYGIEISQNGIYPTQCCMPVNPRDTFAVSKAKRNSHQKRIPESILKAFAAKTATLKPATSFSNFDEYFDYVASEAKKSGVLGNGNRLLVYDYCLRTGYSIGLVPKDYVYLFCGAREGAKAVLGKVGSFRIETTILQKALGTTMDSMEIEDFLCVCKIPLQYLASSCTVSACPSGSCGSAVSTAKVP